MNFDVLEPSKKYLVAVSGGSDSMMLLSMCLKYNLNIIAAHVNYNFRENSKDEQKMVEAFCEKNKIKLYVKACDGKYVGNLEAWAREVRYNFFKVIYDINNCDCLLLGHQLDDHLETFLMMKKRNSNGWYYGIAQKGEHHGMNIYRPLLNLRKYETKDYCLNNNIPFAIDESNYCLDYTRNFIRHTIVENAGDQQIDDWLSEMKCLNDELMTIKNYIINEYNHDEVELNKYRQEKQKIRHLILRWMIEKVETKPLNQSFVTEIDRLLMENNKNGFISINEKYSLYYEYGVFYLDNKKIEYRKIYNELIYEENEYYKLSYEGKTIEGITLDKNDFPIVIRNGEPQDEIHLRFGHKKLNRYFVDRKIPHKKRIRTVVVENCYKRVIFVEGLGCDVSHFTIKPNIFVIK